MFKNLVRSSPAVTDRRANTGFPSSWFSVYSNIQLFKKQKNEKELENKT